MSNKIKRSGPGKRKETTKPSKPAASRKGNAVDRAITAFEGSLNGKNVSVGDYVRLLQLQKDIDDDEPKDIEVTWVEQGETKSSDE